MQSGVSTRATASVVYNLTGEEDTVPKEAPFIKSEKLGSLNSKKREHHDNTNDDDNDDEYDYEPADMTKRFKTSNGTTPINNTTSMQNRASHKKAQFLNQLKLNTVDLDEDTEEDEQESDTDDN